MVRASLVTGAMIGGWSSSCRLPLPQRFCGARPPTTTIGEPANWACAIGADAVGDAGAGGQHGEPGRRGSACRSPRPRTPRSARAARRASRIGGSALTAPSYIGKTWAPDRVNIVSTPCARATATASSPPWPVSSAVSFIGHDRSVTERVRVRTGTTGWSSRSAVDQRRSSRSGRTAGGSAARATSCRCSARRNACGVARSGRRGRGRPRRRTGARRAAAMPGDPRLDAPSSGDEVAAQHRASSPAPSGRARRATRRRVGGRPAAGRRSRRAAR